ncbi:MAG: GH116 family glycosyl-hydrolase, partial [Clostridia bacterium]
MQAMTYKGEYTKEIIFPLGGMGTGSIGMSGAGRLVDWEIANQPNKGSVNGYSHLSVKAVNADGRLLDARVLNGDLAGDYMGQYCQAQYGQYKGYGFGPLAETMAGFPHFSTCVFEARFPFAHLRFTDDAFPGEVTLHAFNPFIPLDADDSSLPAAFFEVTFTNPTAEAIDYTAGFSVGSLFSKETYNTLHQEDGYTSLAWTQCAYAPDDPRYGEVVLATNAARTHAQTHWFRGTWFDAPTVYWEQFARAAPL